MLPQQVGTRAKRLRHFMHLPVLGIGPVEADPHVRPRVGIAIRRFGCAVVVQRIPPRPLVVGLPGEIAALKQQIRRAFAFDDEDHVALDGFAHERHLAEVDSTRPIRRDRQFGCGLPPAFPRPFHPHQRDRLRLAFERPHPMHVPPAGSAVVARAIEIDREFPGRVGADVKRDLLAWVHAGLGAVPLQPRRAKSGASASVEAIVLELPGGRSGAAVLQQRGRVAGGGERGA